MRKILTVLLAAVMLVSAMAVTAFAAEDVIFSSADGVASADCGVANPWDFVNIVGDLWGRGNVIGYSVEDFAAKLDEGATLVMVVGGNTSSTANVAINGVFDAGNAVFTSTDLGDGRYELSVSLADVKAYMDANSITTFDTVCVQTNFNEFTLYEVKFTSGETSAPAETTEPEATTEPETTEPETTEPETTPEPETSAPAETGIALALIPMAIAAAGVVISKRR